MGTIIRTLAVGAALLWPGLTLAQSPTPGQSQGPTQPGDPQSRPLWEIQAFGFGETSPDYPGSGQNHFHALGSPWLVYRGSFFRSDQKNGLRGVIADTPRFELDLSASGSFPVDSHEDAARQGMPDLDWIGQLGPRLRVNLFNAPDFARGEGSRLSVVLPVRAAFSTNFHSRAGYRGWEFAPGLAYEDRNLAGTHLGLTLDAGPVFLDQHFSEYFYGVAAPYATAARPTYVAKGGYLGSTADARLDYPIFRRVNLFGSAEWADFHDSANKNSPLLLARSNHQFLLGFSVSLYQSDERAGPGN